MTVDQQFNVLNDKLQLLLRQYSRLQRENEKLREEIDAARQVHATAQQRIDVLEQQVSILKMGSGEMNEKDKREFEKKINQYLREVDKCIAFLSQ
jgi:outer membrane murein-binding lipoprotein Lpp